MDEAWGLSAEPTFCPLPANLCLVFFFYGGMIDVFQVCLSLSDCVVFVDHVLPAIVPKVT